MKQVIEALCSQRLSACQRFGSPRRINHIPVGGAQEVQQLEAEQSASPQPTPAAAHVNQYFPLWRGLPNGGTCRGCERRKTTRYCSVCFLCETCGAAGSAVCVGAPELEPEPEPEPELAEDAYICRPISAPIEIEPRELVDPLLDPSAAMDHDSGSVRGGVVLPAIARCTSAGEDIGIADKKNWLRFPYDSTFFPGSIISTRTRSLCCVASRVRA